MKKFLFDAHSFDKEKQAPPTYSAEQLEHTRDQGYAQGHTEGLKEACTRQEEKIALCLQKISLSAERLIADEERREIEKSISAVKLAMRVTHKLLPNFAEKFALNEIEHIILGSLDVRHTEPRIAIIVPLAHLEDLKNRIDVLAHEKGYGGKLILIGDETLASSDCRVEWADGGAERLYERIFSQIETEFAKAIGKMNVTLADIPSVDKT